MVASEQVILKSESWIILGDAWIPQKLRETKYQAWLTFELRGLSTELHWKSDFVTDIGDGSNGLIQFETELFNSTILCRLTHDEIAVQQFDVIWHMKLDQTVHRKIPS
jgi:hypothetical protein